MKKFLLFLSIILWCGCSNELPFDTDSADVSVKTRAANDSTYYLGASDFNNVENFVIAPKDDMKPLSRTLFSYVEVNGIKTLLQPEIVSKPSWLEYIVCFQYNDMYVLSVVAEDNTSSSKRSGVIVLKQPVSNKMLSIGIIQNGKDNWVSVNMQESFPNHPVFTATTTYPVKKDITCCVPYEVYNDGGIYDGNATIKIPQGETKGIYEMDYNGSQLVHEHGNVKYRLHEGTILGDDVYTYSFIRYW